MQKIVLISQQRRDRREISPAAPSRQQIKKKIALARQMRIDLGQQGEQMGKPAGRHRQRHFFRQPAAAQGDPQGTFCNPY